MARNVRGPSGPQGFDRAERRRAAVSARRRGHGRGGGGSFLPWALAAVGAAIVLIIAVAVMGNRGGGAPGGAVSQPTARTAVPQAVMTDLTGIPEATWNAVGASGSQPPIEVAKTASSGKPLVLYIGAEYCPYCAAERWSVITALSRFGTFHGLTLARSSATDVYPNTPTFSFYGATYQSPYLTFQSREIQSGVQLSNGQYAALQKLTAAQQALMTKYDAPPYVSQATADSIPFVLMGGRFLWVGASYSPQLLQGLTWQSVAGSLAAGKTAAAKAILANANQMTAAICAADGGQPAAVCNSAGVKAAAAKPPVVK